jgi:hypothetical protein
MLTLTTVAVAVVLFTVLVASFLADVLRAGVSQLRDDLPSLPTLELSWETRLEAARLQTLLHNGAERLAEAVVDGAAHLVLDAADWALERWAELTTPDVVSAPTSLIGTVGVVPDTCRDPAEGGDHWAMIDAQRITGTVWADLPKTTVQPAHPVHQPARHGSDLPMRLARHARQRDVASGWFAV